MQSPLSARTPRGGAPLGELSDEERKRKEMFQLRRDGFANNIEDLEDALEADSAMERMAAMDKVLLVFGQDPSAASDRALAALVPNIVERICDFLMVGNVPSLSHPDPSDRFNSPTSPFQLIPTHLSTHALFRSRDSQSLLLPDAARWRTTRVGLSVGGGGGHVIGDIRLVLLHDTKANHPSSSGSF